MSKRKGELKTVMKELIAEVGPVSTSGYVDGKRELKQALSGILDEPKDAAKVFSALEADGYLRFVNRVGYDAAEAHWRLVKNPWGL